MNDQKIPDNEQLATAKITQWCLGIILLAFVCQMSLSLHLWLPIDRHYPLFSLLPFHYPIGLTAVLNAGLLLGLGVAFFSVVWRKRGLLLALTCFFLLVIEDVNRFQPWAYVYMTLLGTIAWQWGRSRRCLATACGLGLSHRRRAAWRRRRAACPVLSLCLGAVSGPYRARCLSQHWRRG